MIIDKCDSLDEAKQRLAELNDDEKEKDQEKRRTDRMVSPLCSF